MEEEDVRDVIWKRRREQREEWPGGGGATRNSSVVCCRRGVNHVGGTTEEPEFGSCFLATLCTHTWNFGFVFLRAITNNPRTWYLVYERK